MRVFVVEPVKDGEAHIMVVRLKGSPFKSIPEAIKAVREQKHQKKFNLAKLEWDEPDQLECEENWRFKRWGRKKVKPPAKK